MAKRGVGGIQRRGDSSGLDSERGRDRLVVEIGVVTKKDHQALPFGQGRDPGADFLVLGRLSVRCRLGHDLEWIEHRFSSPRALGRVYDRAPEPGLEWAFAAKRPPLPDRVREPVLNDIVRRRLIADNGSSDLHEVRIALFVELFQVFELGAFRHHYPFDATTRRFCLAGLTCGSAQRSFPPRSRARRSATAWALYS